MLTFIASFLSTSFVLVPPVEVQAGLGQLAIVCEEGASPPVGGTTSAVSVAAVAALLAGDVINAAGAAQATAALSQTYAPSIVYFGTYTSAEDPSDGLDNLVAAGIDFGVAVIDSVVDADIAAVGTWLATGQRYLDYLIFAESRNADLKTSGKPAALANFELDGAVLSFGASAVGLAGARAGFLQGKGLIGGPAAAQVQIGGIDLPGLTATEAALTIANDCGVLLPQDLGASASQRILRGTSTYSGTGFTVWSTVLYTVRRARAGITALIARKAALGEPLLNNTIGVGEVIAAVDGQLAPLAAVGHFTSGVSSSGASYPDGYTVTAVASGTTIAVTMRVLIGQEVFSITLNGIGEVVS